MSVVYPANRGAAAEPDPATFRAALDDPLPVSLLPVVFPVVSLPDPFTGPPASELVVLLPLELPVAVLVLPV